MNNLLIERQFNKGKKFAIFGCGEIAQEFMQDLHNCGQEKLLKEFHCVFDNNLEKQGSKFNGLDVVSPDWIKDIPNLFIVVASNEKNYNQIRLQLEQMGLLVYRDFIHCNRLFPEKMMKVSFELSSLNNYQEEGKKFAIFGCGEIAQEFMQDLRNCGQEKLLKEFHCVFDNNLEKQGSKFNGLDVVSPDWIKDIPNLFIIVASNEKNYNQIRLQLEQMGLLVYRDFIFYEWLFPERLIQFPLVLDELRNRSYIRGQLFIAFLKKLKPWVDESKFLNQLEVSLEDILYGEESVELCCLKAFCKDHVFYLKDACIEYMDENRLLVMVKELLFLEVLFFKASNSKPFIVDGGSNIGLAIYYFQHLYPQAQIYAFEPVKEIYEICLRNITYNNWNNVKLMNYALDSCKRDAIIHIPSNDCLGATLTNRAWEQVKKVQVDGQKVKTIMLSCYIKHKMVDYLKLDIEGVEARVLRDIKDQLKNIKCIFCEYHFGETLDDNSLCEILNILVEAGFKYRITSQPGDNHAKKMMNNVGKRYSLNIWAKRNSLMSL